MRVHLFLFSTNLKYLIMLKAAFSGHKPQYSSTELKNFLLNLFTSYLQDFCTPIKHTSLQNSATWLQPYSVGVELCVTSVLIISIQEEYAGNVNFFFVLNLEKQYSLKFIVSIIQTVCEIFRSLGLLVGL